MIEKLKPHSAYRAANLPWLARIPAHWELLRGKNAFRCIDVRSATGAEELLTVSSEHGVVPRKSATVTMFQAESYVGYKLCWPGDLVINSLWAWARGLGVSRYHGIVSSAYGVYRLKSPFETYSRFIHELVRSVPFNWELRVRSKGIWTSRLQLTDEAFLDAPLPLPPASEQASISRFISYTDRRVRRYIAAKKKLIGLLNEQKHAVINHSLVSILDGSVRTKPSGLLWPTEVPRHWRILRLKNLVTRVTSGSRGWSDFAADSGPLFIRIGNLTRSSIELDLSSVVRLQLPPSALAESNRTRISEDDILLSITAYIGSVGLVPHGIGEAYISQHVACCRLRLGSENPRWLAYVLLSEVGQTYGRNCMYGGTKQGLSLDDVKGYPILLPPRKEQDALVQQIERGLNDIRERSQRVERSISLAREYRMRLIADVVTGKLDVREAAAHLPEETAEDEPVEEAEALDEDDEREIDASIEEAEA